jgi:UPF0716 family protein affecting phage T7 exclusion
MNANRILNALITFLLGLVLLIPPAGMTACSPGKSASVYKAEKEKTRKDKEAQKKYEQAVKRHMKKQSKTTQSMMKKTKKETPKNTPLKHASGKKCK